MTKETDGAGVLADLFDWFDSFLLPLGSWNDTSTSTKIRMTVILLLSKLAFAFRGIALLCWVGAPRPAICNLQQQQSPAHDRKSAIHI
jgi:hypothetical protein